MTTIADYAALDATAMAEAIRNGDFSSEDVLKEAIRLMHKRNPDLNAITFPVEGNAGDALRSGAGEGLFNGVPFLLKDAHHALKGVPMSCGSNLLKHVDPKYDAEIVNRFLSAGLVILGKTNTPEFKLAYTTEPEAFGPTRNPYNLDYSSGGSSGGSAAAVAARIVPMASATDEGGSIRVPASYCGVFGFKPSRGRTPVGPNFQDDWDGLSHSHVITRSVRDSAAMLDLISGREAGSPYQLEPPEESFLSAVSELPGKLKIGYHAQSAFGQTVHPDCAEALEATVQLLKELGHQVEKVDPGYNEDEVAFLWVTVMLKNMAELVGGLVDTVGSKAVNENLELTSRTLCFLGKQLTENDFQAAKTGWETMTRTMAGVFQTCDVVVTPTLGKPPIRLGTTGTRFRRIKMKALQVSPLKQLLQASWLRGFVIRQLIKDSMKDQMPYTMIANITGQPAMSVPLHWSGQGLPIGLQFLGQYGDERTLFKLAGQLETARPWKDKLPAVAAGQVST